MFIVGLIPDVKKTFFNVLFNHYQQYFSSFLLQTTSSESTLICLLAGRCQAIKNYQKLYPDVEDAEINSRLVAYCSDQAHSSLQKAALIGLVKMHYIESDENLSMRGPRLLQAIKKDRELGLIPFWVSNFVCHYKK